MKRRKILKKVCEMSKYLTLIPLLRQMCFPYSHSCWGEKMTWWFWEISLSFFFFFFLEEMWFGFEPCRDTPELHLSTSIFFSVLHLILFLYVSISCEESRYRIPDTSSIFLSLLLLFILGWSRDDSHSICFCHLFFFLPPSISELSPPSIFLFFLNVIVKCSSEMTLNMCTLTEGIHLVIYFLLPVSCGLFLRLCKLSMSYCMEFWVSHGGVWGSDWWRWCCHGFRKICSTSVSLHRPSEKDFHRLEEERSRWSWLLPWTRHM